MYTVTVHLASVNDLKAEQETEHYDVIALSLFHTVTALQFITF